jgi:hypothetical protein
VLQTVGVEQDQIYVVRGQVYSVVATTVQVTLALPPKTTLTTTGLAIVASDQVLRIKDTTLVSLAATSVVGISQIRYRVDSGAWTVYSTSFTMAVGAHTLNYYATDTFGLDGPTYTQNVQVANASPAPSNALINYPNPFRAGREPVILEYNLSAASSVRLRIFNLIGQLVYEKSLQQGETGTAAGVNQISWDGRNGSGTVIGNDSYIAVLQIDRTNER